jgi:hypothetical protein
MTDQPFDPDTFGMLTLADQCAVWRQAFGAPTYDPGCMAPAVELDDDEVECFRRWSHRVKVRDGHVYTHFQMPPGHEREAVGTNADLEPDYSLEEHGGWHVYATDEARRKPRAGRPSMSSEGATAGGDSAPVHRTRMSAVEYRESERRRVARYRARMRAELGDD